MKVFSSSVWKTHVALWDDIFNLGACPWDVCVGRGKRDRNFGKKAQNPGKIVEDIKAKI